MSKWQCYEDRKKFILATAQGCYQLLDDNDKAQMKSTLDSLWHCAPEAYPTMWKRLYTCMCHFSETGPDGKHLKPLELYNSRYKEFRKTYMNDNSY